MMAKRRGALVSTAALLICVLARQTDGAHGSSSGSSSSTPPLSSSVAPNATTRSFYFNSSRDAPGLERRRPAVGVSPVCAYRVIEGGIWGQLCFRRTMFGFQCHERECRTKVSSGNLSASLLANGSVLLQWSHEGGSAEAAGQGERRGRGDSRFTRTFGERRRRTGFEVSCWWNGSYTQFECAGVHLASGCRDFLMAELHENVPYRVCVRALLADAHKTQQGQQERQDCVEFTLPHSGMQDIVIAMTTVGGAICVMLVIICLLVAYITENIMTPANQLSHPYRPHPRH